MDEQVPLDHVRGNHQITNAMETTTIAESEAMGMTAAWERPMVAV